MPAAIAAMQLEADDTRRTALDRQRPQLVVADIAVEDAAHAAIVRYDFVREANSGKIDDIKGSSDGEAWSIRKMLTDSLKS